MKDRHRAALAYKNEKFLDSNDARPLRILAEYLQPLYAFEREQICGTVVFFGSARLREDGPLGRYYRDARELGRLVTLWSKELSSDICHCVVCTGGGGGIMEAANRGAMDANGKSIGLNIGLPHEQRPNAYITPSLSFEFHYFFMRKLWFAHLARALIVFPGGFGTLDEMFELLTLAQTGKLARRIPVVLYGRSYWNEIVDFDALARYGMIAPEDLALFTYADDPLTALGYVQREVPPCEEPPKTPDFAHSRKPPAAAA
ncbi:MAG TPA: TIGR00730 family Rossman fold protein [Casimicrobiaceae bacterium]|nr:TIGR00730 family Rossman fold protein [Casimicrobiaceae bacterium]